MDRICAYCHKSIQNAGDIQFCPYCGTSVMQANMANVHDNVAWKIETTWGNQAIYAEKIKMLCGELIQCIDAWIEEENSTFFEKESMQYVVSQQLIDDFEFLRSAPNSEELEHEFRAFIRNLKSICSGEKVLRATRVVSTDLDTYIRDNLHSFEAMLGLSVSENPMISEDCNYENFRIAGSTDFDGMFNVLEQAFHCVKRIVQHQGFLCVQNCNYTSGSIQLLGAYSQVDRHGVLTFNLGGVISELHTSCDHDYTDLFDESYEKHLILFFEGLWILLQGILAKYQHDQKHDDETSCQEYMEEWLSCLEVSIDRVKYQEDTDMTSMYLAARKAYSIIKRKFT